ncbi:amidase domain-containing protein [Streptomyces acidiscabies]|uniref:amidase domain-containing protein n=1 Tax=Streptomyces acidiscabies TaxID=42234 RepID=UPI0009A0F3EA|nr:amidase domain-containing protein [Streptomyces acidiscabies]
MTEGTTELFGALAEAVIERRTAALLDTPAPAALTAKLATSTRGPVHLSSATVAEEYAVVGELADLKKELAEIPEAYTAAETATTVDSVKVDGTTATVVVTEDTALTYKQIHGDEPPTTEFQAEHRFVYSLGADGTWALTASEPVNTSGPAPINQVAVSPADLTVPEPAEEANVEDGTEDPDDGPALPPGTGDKPGDTAEDPAPLVGPLSSDTRRVSVKNLGEEPQKSADGVALAASYNYSAMAKYAEKYWKNYNSAYRKFDGKGGDCTNFISQSLRAGGWKNKSGWYRNANYWWYNSSNQTYSWTGVDHWATFAKKSGRTSILGNVYNMGIGDILQMDFNRAGGKDHSMIATHLANGQPYLTYHSNNTYRRSMASIVKAYPNATYYAHRT